MKSMFRDVLVLMAAAGLAVAVHAANGAPDGAPLAQADAAPEAVVGPLKLQKTYLDNGNHTGLALPANTFQIVGTPVTLNCGVAAGCTVIAALETQIKMAGTNQPAICFFVDDAQISCPFVDSVKETTGFKTMSHQSSTKLTQGNHTLQMRAYSKVATQLFYYQAEYRLYDK